ncbi:MAG: hypothetical protein RBT36_01290 [Desulfobulbus sp.]|jgi:hypothetical protein|nr:hypothetical protein [Desulfobulbus sp.]
MRHILLLLFAALFLLGGCHGKQIRHLASDAALIKPGESTIRDVQKYLGEPNGRRDVAPGVAELVYYEDRPGFFGNVPVLGSMTSSTGYEMIVVTLENDQVTDCEFRTFNKKDHKWVEDFTWEEIQ